MIFLLNETVKLSRVIKTTQNVNVSDIPHWIIIRLIPIRLILHVFKCQHMYI